MRWISDDEVREHSHGRVTNPQSYNFVTHVPEKGGLYCQAIFGRTPWADDDPTVTATLAKLSARIRPGGDAEYEAFDEKRRELLAYRLTHIANDDRSERCGHIELTKPIPRANGPARSVMLVVPPAYRPFRFLSDEEWRAWARSRRAELIALAASDDWPYDDSLETILGEAGIETEEDIEAGGRGAREEHPLNAAYRAVINRANRYERLVQLGAPPDALDGEERALGPACDAVDDLVRSSEIPIALKRLALGQ